MFLVCVGHKQGFDAKSTPRSGPTTPDASFVLRLVGTGSGVLLANSGWLPGLRAYFPILLDGIADGARRVVRDVQAILELREEHRQMMARELTHQSGIGYVLPDNLFERPVVTIRE